LNFADATVAQLLIPVEDFDRGTAFYRDAPGPSVVMASVVKAWRCPNCSADVPSAFCPACGERPVGPPDLTFRGLLAQFTKAISGIDGRLVRTFGSLLVNPGALTNAYAQGRRKPFIGPFQLFLIANVVFFAVQSMTHTKVFSSTLDSHLHHQDWSELAQQLVTQRLQTTHRSLESYAPLFDQAAGVLMGGPGLESARVDNVLTAINVVACTAYLYVATGAVYASTGAGRVLKAFALALAVGAIVLGYRFLVFLFTLYMI
jgi:hypothetical protein